jgi:toxin ParE1/3/4
VTDRKYRLTRLADADLYDILSHTLLEFGDLQLISYASMIDKAMRMVGDQPLRPSSRARDELGPGVRSFHVEIAAGRQGAASHVLYYIPEVMEDGTLAAIILRVLWEGMEPRRYIEPGLGKAGGEQ